MAQAAAYVAETGTTLAEYLDLFENRRKELWEHEQPPHDYPDTVGTTWSLAMDRVRDESPVATDLLNLCAFLAPEDIPKWLSTKGREHLPKRLRTGISDELRFAALIKPLRRYSLIEVLGDKLTVHRMVQAATRDRLDATARKRWVEVAVKTVNAAYPHDSDDVRTWSECVPLSPHASQVCERAERLTIAPEATGRLLNQLGLYLNNRAEFGRARTCYERALGIFRKFLGDEHPNTQTVRKKLESLDRRWWARWWG